MTMNNEQIMSVIRALLKVVGSVLATYGILDPATAGSVVEQTAVVVGALMALGGTLWGIFGKTDKKIVAAAASLPEVKSVRVTTQAMADAIGPKAHGPNDPLLVVPKKAG
jgi:hypothetical protein